jgi:ABC-2 type transport system ATP-binding protein
MNHIIQTQDLSYAYGKFLALKRLNLSVEKGEIFGFLGPNGAGKTTTIRILLDFIRPMKGQATLFGLDSRRASREIRQQLGYLPSELTLWENWTGEQYIRWLEGVRKASLLSHAQYLAERLEYDLGRKLSGLSTGMKRKMGLIAALAHQPKLLILDEPTNGLDPLMQKVFHELLREIRAQGRTVFLSSHILPEVEAICDRVAIIRKGELQAVEKVSDLTRVAFRWLTFTFGEEVSPATFAQFDGVSETQVLDEQRLRLRLSGKASLDAVLKQAAQFTIHDLQMEHPSLEEIFLSYYGG